MNYFNYFTEIEDAFVRRRGKHLLVSSLDWALIESWKEMGIPLHVALRGIERAFDSWEAKPRKRTVKSLLYCQEEVEAQFAEWIESRDGAGTKTNHGDNAASDALPFSRARVLEHMGRVEAQLQSSFNERRRRHADDLAEAFGRACSRLQELARDFAASTVADSRKLEDSLTGVERLLSDALRMAVSNEQLGEIRKEVELQLRPYRKNMERSIYEQTLDNLLLKRLREQYAVPRLSLFYLS